jgi:dephospho-CoA kinase
MSKWAGKYVIGLTGNIGTGKSVVRKMLEHLGAYGIDADMLAHRAISKDAPGYQQVLQIFGKWVLEEDGQINRARLGALVFANPTALQQLEKVVHPLVGQATDFMIRRASQPVIVIEAIKLIEAGTKADCDSTWVVTVPEAVQVERLVKQRGMNEEQARLRIKAQSSQEEKIAQANVVINNEGSYDKTWQQVLSAWEKMVPAKADNIMTVSARRVAGSSLIVRPGKPRHSAEIAAFINQFQKDGRPVTAEDIMGEFGEKAYLLLRSNEKLVGCMGWQVENLVARAMDFLLSPEAPADESLTALTKEMERASRDLQCEISLISVPSRYREFHGIWSSLGYAPCTPSELDIQAWQEAAREIASPGTIMYCKQLRQDRVLRPI